MNLPRRFLGAIAGAALFAVGSTALASETAALYQAYWAGLPAGDIKLVLQDDPGGYRDEIAIRSEGLAWLFTKFRGAAIAEGRFADGPPAPRRLGQQWRDALPFRIGQITRITPSLKRRLSLTVLFRPHPPYVAQRPPLSEPMPYSQTGSNEMPQIVA